MKTLRAIGLLALVALSGSLFAAATPPVKEMKPSPSNPLAPRFKQVRERIDSLFQHRSETPTPFDPGSNPFRLPGTVPATPLAGGTAGADETPPPSPVNNLTLLQQAAATLKVSGTFEVGNRSHLVINARPYKQGDVVQTTVQGETVYVRVKEIFKRSVTLTLNDAEMSLKF